MEIRAVFVTLHRSLRWWLHTVVRSYCVECAVVKCATSSAANFVSICLTTASFSADYSRIDWVFQRSAKEERLEILEAECPSCHPANSVKALKYNWDKNNKNNSNKLETTRRNSSNSPYSRRASVSQYRINKNTLSLTVTTSLTTARFSFQLLLNSCTF